MRLIYQLAMGSLLLVASFGIILSINTLTRAVDALDAHLSKFDELGIRATADLRQFDQAKDLAQNGSLPAPSILPDSSRLQRWAIPSHK